MLIVMVAAVVEIIVDVVLSVALLALVLMELRVLTCFPLTVRFAHILVVSCSPVPPF